MEPVCPARSRVPWRSSCRPSPWELSGAPRSAGADGTRISATVSAARTAFVAVEQEAAVAAEVGGRGPQLARRGHEPGVLGRLGQQRVRPRMHRPARRVRRLRVVGGAVHPERVEDLGLQRRGPVPPAQPPDEGSEQREPDVRVVVAPARAAQRGHRDEAREVGAHGAVGALPPRRPGLGGEPGGVGEQLRDRRIGDRRVGEVVAEGVVETQEPLVAQAQDEHRDERLGDRPDAVLRVRGRCAVVDAAAAPGPHRLPPRTTAPAIDGARPRDCSTASRWSSARAVPSSSGGVDLLSSTPDILALA